MANCSQCGSAVTDGATFCPVCGTPTTVGGAPTAAAAPPGADSGFGATGAGAASGFGATAGGSGTGAMPAFKADLTNLTTLDRVAAGATLVLFIAIFFSWYHVSGLCGSGVTVGACSVSANGTYHGWMYLTVILCLAVLAAYVAKLGFGKLPFTLPITDAQLILGMTGLNLLLVFIAFIDKPSFTSWSFGAFIGLLAAIVALAPALWPLAQKQMAARK